MKGGEPPESLLVLPHHGGKERQLEGICFALEGAILLLADIEVLSASRVSPSSRPLGTKSMP